MVQTDPGHLAVSESKQQSTEESYRHGSSFRSDSQQFHSLQRPRAADFATFGKSSLISPAQTAGSDSAAIYGNHSLQSTLRDSGLRVHTAYGPSAQENYYNPHHIAYTSAASPSSYSPTAPSDPMATTAQMQRPAYPPIYHTPQSNSPASVASQPHDPHGRHMYTHSPQMPHQMYGYPQYGPMNPVQPSPYATHGPPAQTHPLTSQSMMMPPQTTTAAHISQHQSQHASAPSLSSSPILKMDSTTQNASMQRPMLNPPLFSPSQVNMPSGGIHQVSSTGTSSSAAPGPIPATTPLVVRQDSNGVQWIAFEYSRDRVKMEYTIRCDVESVNVDNLSQDFKTENCVYPRACCSKDQYRGNRLVYETECNTVGWALAELNPSLRGKRGLIQRAVDSWRNSNQDQRLRSRRVRRQAKANYRKQSTAPPTPHMPTAMGLGSGLPSVPAMSGHQGPRHSLSGPGTMSGMAPPQLHHHHHTHLDGSPKIEEVSGPTELTDASQRRDDPAATPAVPVPADLRPAQTFHDASRHPPSTSTRPSMPPLLHESGLGAPAPSRTIATSTRQMRATDSNNSEGDEVRPSNDDLFGALPAGKRRTFILVEDPQRGARVRVKVTLDKVNMDEIPDSYRKANAVYPRTYFPIQMRDAPGASVPHSRFSRDDAELGDDAEVAVGRTIVLAPSLDGDYEIEVPQLSRRRHRKEVLLNDLSYRLSWSQSRVFAERMLFLQRSLDAYRNKMRSSILAAGSDPSEVPDHFDTRCGKRRFLQRCAQSNDEGGVESGSGAVSRRAVEEIE
ncbi:Uncharacterized protein PECH_005888 [Penicillium ucsense]|uniref:DUF8032 domain-containing protein n=1 Tax=Penicillium ucsense TaxID=2839758 RepID=A0A8J8W999_9EURO|nr:Uncharacterized protein PECM_000699 [Penicillium ucsense]KAF7736072.1 Uncharacterized protein PECH_005888 [Penicillium ucsense]